MPGATPLRDSLSINDPDAALVGQSIGRREEKARAKEALRGPPNGALFPPRTANEYEIVAPELPAEARSRARRARRRARAMEEDAVGVLRREEACTRGERYNVLARPPRPKFAATLKQPASSSSSASEERPLGSSPASPAARRRRGGMARARRERGGEPQSAAAPLPELLPRVEPSEMEDAAALIASEVVFVRSAMATVRRRRQSTSTRRWQCAGIDRPRGGRRGDAEKLGKTGGTRGGVPAEHS